MKKSTGSSKIDKNIDDQRKTLSEEFAQLNQDFQTILQHVKHAGSELTKDASQEVWSRVERIAAKFMDINERFTSITGGYVANGFAKTKEKSYEYAHELETKVKEHPLPSVAISFGVGLIISKVIGSWLSQR
jgi:ElaB/YqjD/DUF883 family membrane-anchored ribosome-binding protein